MCVLTINKANFAPWGNSVKLSGVGLTERMDLLKNVSGFYKKTPRGIQLMDMDGKLFAFITNNDSGFIVSASRCEESGNKIRYMFALMSLEARDRFGYESETLSGGLSNEDRKHLDGEVRKALIQLGFRAE